MDTESMIDNLKRAYKVNMRNFMRWRITENTAGTFSLYALEERRFLWNRWHFIDAYITRDAAYDAMVALQHELEAARRGEVIVDSGDFK